MHRLSFLICLWITLLLAACAPVSSVPDVPTEMQVTSQPSSAPDQSLPTGAPTVEPLTASSTSQPSPPTTSISASFEFYPGNPVLSGSHDWDRVYIDPGAIVYHDDQFHMFYNGIDGFPRPVGVGYATSPDGIQWEPQVTQPLFHASDLYPDHPRIQNLFVTSGLVQPDGTWVLYFYTLEGPDFMHEQSIGRATAPDPKGPWIADPQIVLQPGVEGAWDDLQVGSPKVLPTSDGYVMYFDGMNQDGTSRIGLATSPDGVQWTKHNDPATTDALYAESDPVLEPTLNGWDQKRVIAPNVLPTSTGWLMIYLSTTCQKKFGSCEYNYGQASSSDGIHWQKFTDSPVLSSVDHPDWQASYLATLAQGDDGLLLFMDYSGKNFQGTRIYLAMIEGQTLP